MWLVPTKDEKHVALTSGSHSGQAFLGMMSPSGVTGFYSD